MEARGGIKYLTTALRQEITTKYYIYIHGITFSAFIIDLMSQMDCRENLYKNMSHIYIYGYTNRAGMRFFQIYI